MRAKQTNNQGFGPAVIVVGASRISPTSNPCRAGLLPGEEFASEATEHAFNNKLGAPA
jgi:hypothetical protein